MIPKREIKVLKSKIKKLKKNNKNIIISDLDDTIFSTKSVIDNDYREGRRGPEGNAFILENNLIDIIIDNEYKNKSYSDKISGKLKEKQDLILTTGIEEYQLKKIKALNLEHINKYIVKNPNEKVKQVILYIIEVLKYIPASITIYEDRPKFFIEFKDLLEDILGIKIKIMFVELKDNNSEPKITEVI